MNKLIQKVTLDGILKTADKLEYPVFREGYYNINFGGIRASNREANSFDDLLYVFFRHPNEKRFSFYKYPATVDPGLPWLKKPMAQGGAAIVAPGFHRGLWHVGSKFRGRACLRQRIPIRIYRDDNRDSFIDIDPDTLESGMYGILVHPHFQNREQAELVGRSSAGCIVPQSNRDFEHLYACCETSSMFYGNSISWTLFDESEVIKAS